MGLYRTIIGYKLCKPLHSGKVGGLHLVCLVNSKQIYNWDQLKLQTDLSMAMVMNLVVDKRGDDNHGWVQMCFPIKLKKMISSLC